MESFEYIDNYFGKKLSADEAVKFEQRIKEDVLFAEEVSFYLSSKKAVSNLLDIEKKKRFKEIYQSKAPALPQKRMIRLWPAAAAAAVIIGIVFGVFTWMKPVSTEQLAEKYIQNKLQTLGVTMDSKEDSLQTGLRLYNELKYTEALQQFESIIQKDNSNFTAIEYAGIVSLRLAQYDKAISWFKKLSGQPGLYSNPGKFYQALTLMKRNLPGDKANAQQLLQEVVSNDLTGKVEAEQWLKNW